MIDHTSGMLFSAFAAALLVALWLVRGGSVGRTAILIAALAPPLVLMLLTLTSRERMGDLRLELRSLHFSGTGPVTIGSDPQRNHLVIVQREKDWVNLGPDFAGIVWDGCPPPQGPCIKQSPAARGNGMIKVGSAWLGAVPFADHAVCFAGQRIGYDSAAGWLTVNGALAGAPLPLQTDRIYQLRDLVGTGGDSLVKVDERGTLMAIAAGAGAQAVPASAVCPPAGTPETVSSMSLAQMPRIAVSLVKRPLASDVSAAKAQYGDDPSKWLEKAEVSLDERRSVKVTSLNQGITVMPDTPDTFRLPHSAEARERMDKEGGRQISLGDLGSVLLGTTIEQRRFPLVGKPLAAKLYQLIALCTEPKPCEAEVRGSEAKPDAAASDVESTRIAGWFAPARNRIAGLFADREEMFGSAAGDHIVVRLRTLDLGYYPFALAFWGGLAALVLSALVTHRLRKASAALFAVLVLIDVLLLMRLMIGFEAALISPNQRNLLGMVSALMALFAIPAVLAAIGRSFGLASPSRWRYALGAAAALTASAGLAFVARDWIGAGSWGNYAGLFFLTLGIAALVPVLWIAAPVWQWFKARRAAAKPAQTEEAPARSSLLERIEPRHMKFAPLAIIGLCAALAVAGAFIESILDGTRYLVLLLAFGWALAWNGAEDAVMPDAAPAKKDASRIAGLWRSLWPLALRLAVPVLAVAFFLLDNGYVLVTAFSLGLVFLAMLQWRPVEGSPRRLAKFSALILNAFMVLVWLAAYSFAPPEYVRTENNRISDAKVAQMLETSSSYNSAQAERFHDRFIAFASPSRLREVGTISSEQARAEFFLMSEYANQGLWGRGWHNQPNLKGMHATQSADFAPAVHLMTPFGRAGLVGFLLLLCAAAWTFQQQIGRSLNLVSGAAVAGPWLLLGGSLYVSLANLMLVPFTGRNLIMTAPFSAGDLLDGLALTMPAFALALWQVRRPQAEAEVIA